MMRRFPFLSWILARVDRPPEPDVTYGLQPLEIAASTADKDRVKSIDQWISILHADLFGEALGSAELFEITSLFSVGDQEIAREVLVSNFMQEEDVQLPDPGAMTSDPDAFVDSMWHQVAAHSRPSTGCGISSRPIPP